MGPSWLGTDGKRENEDSSSRPDARTGVTFPLPPRPSTDGRLQEGFDPATPHCRGGRSLLCPVLRVGVVRDRETA